MQLFVLQRKCAASKDDASLSLSLALSLSLSLSLSFILSLCFALSIAAVVVLRTVAALFDKHMLSTTPLKVVSQHLCRRMSTLSVRSGTRDCVCHAYLAYRETNKMNLYQQRESRKYTSRLRGLEHAEPCWPMLQNIYYDNY